MRGFRQQLLAFPVLVTVLVATTFLFGGRCAAWQWWAGFALTVAFGFVSQGRAAWKTSLAFAGFLAIIWVVGGILINPGWTDSCTCHQPAVRLLIEGWNPIAEATWPEVERAFGLPSDSVKPLHILFMPKGVWYFDAAAFFFLRNPENLLWAPMAFLGVSVILTIWRSTRHAGCLASLSSIFLAWAIELPYLLTVDGVVALAATGLFFAMWSAARAGEWDRIELAVYTFWMLTAKPSSLLHALVFWAIFGAVTVWRCRARWSEVARKAARPLAALALAFAVTSASPFATAWRDEGHPLYPRFTADPVRHPAVDLIGDFHDRNEDAAAMGHLGAYVNAFVSKSLAHWHYRRTLERPDFCPHSVVWEQQIGDSVKTGSPTSPLAKAMFVLSFVILMIFGSWPERMIAVMVVAGTMALPTELLGYVRYTPWSLVGIPFAALTLARTGSYGFRLGAVLAALAIGAVLGPGRQVAAWSALVDEAAAQRELLAASPLARMYVFLEGRDSRCCFGNLLLLRRSLPPLAKAELVFADGDTPEAAAYRQSLADYPDFYDRNFKVEPSVDLARLSARRRLIAEPDRLRRYLKWPGVILRTAFVTAPRAILRRLGELVPDGVPFAGKGRR